MRGFFYILGHAQIVVCPRSIFRWGNPNLCARDHWKVEDHR